MEKGTATMLGLLGVFLGLYIYEWRKFCKISEDPETIKALHTLCTSGPRKPKKVLESKED